MSMAMVLEGSQDFLRQLYEWKPTECVVAPETLPTASAGPFFIGIDEGSVEGGEENSHKLKEVFNIEIGIWRRPHNLPKDRWREYLKVQNMYLPEVATLDTLERQVITALHGYGKRNGGPSLWEFINTKFQLPISGRGDRFNGTLMYKGRGKSEVISLPAEEGGGEFYGRRLRFRGLDRTQSTTQMG